jgi:hypothetical protein
MMDFGAGGALLPGGLGGGSIAILKVRFCCVLEEVDEVDEK